MSLSRLAVIAAVSLAVPASAASQTLERVKSLYVAAAYEEALAAMPAEPTDEAKTDLEQYRALCLLALGREAEAIASMERLVKSSPTYLPPQREMSPRMVAMFADVRAKLVPELARQVYSDAKQAFDAKNAESAHAGFKRTLEMIDSLPETDRGSLADLRLLAEGFLDLAAAARPAPVPSLASAADASGKASTKPAVEYLPPVAIREQLPVWAPPDSAAMQTEYQGLLQVNIGEDGAVTSATIVKSSHPMYDAALMRAAKEWTYQPATRGGRPVASQKNIQIRLVPR